MAKIKKLMIPIFLCILFLFTSCSTPAVTLSTSEINETIESAVMTAVTPVPEPSSTPTPEPSRNLVICLENEPESLYLYGSSSRSAASVLESIYDGPFDVLDYEPQAVILKKTPSYEDGDAVFQPVSVNDGDSVVDIHGELVALALGVQVMPSGCTSMDCSITWDGIIALQMDQEVVTYGLRSDIVWSDGARLTAQDSVYSFQVAADENTQVSHQLVYRTENYTALDETHVQWSGVPGYFPERLDTVFWSPLPEHAWGSMTPTDLQTNEISTKYPIGWGPYVIEEWVSGDHIQLKKNPLYFRSAEGLPAFDHVVYRFLGEEGDSLIGALKSKECDLIDQSSSLESQLSEIKELETQGELKTHISVGPEWEQLTFGIDHSSYDDGYSPFSGVRPDFFSDGRTRQAFAYCIDRTKIVDELLQGLSYIPSTYLPDSHPLHDQDAQIYAYDPEMGQQLLDQVGWKDLDGNPDTPLQSLGISSIQDGTPFSINYYTTQAVLRQQIAEVIRDSLNNCGIEVNVVSYTPDEMYAEGSAGPLFGRNFDLAQFAWSSGVLPLCEFYVSEQIPSAGNNWLTLNIGGYKNPTYDSACQSSLIIRPDQTEEYASQQREVQNMFSAELPVIPLYFRLKVALSRTDLCGLSSEYSSGSMLWNLEELNYGEGCQQ